MSRDDIIRMAREAGLLEIIDDAYRERADWGDYAEHFFRAAYAAGAAAEREACAQLCDDLVRSYWNSTGDEDEPDAYDCAAAIRARGAND